jgi:hypothetical protein
LLRNQSLYVHAQLPQTSLKGTVGLWNVTFQDCAPCISLAPPLADSLHDERSTDIRFST